MQQRTCVTCFDNSFAELLVWFGRGKNSSWLHSSHVLWLFEHKCISSALTAIPTQPFTSFFLLCTSLNHHTITDFFNISKKKTEIPLLWEWALRQWHAIHQWVWAGAHIPAREVSQRVTRICTCTRCVTSGWSFYSHALSMALHRPMLLGKSRAK